MTSPKIKRFRIQDIDPGTVLGRSVIAENGATVLYEGTILTAGLLDRLYSWGIFAVEIYCDPPDDQMLTAESSYYHIYRQFARRYEETLTALNEILAAIDRTRRIPLPALQKIAADSITKMSASSGVLAFLPNIYHDDTDMINHSLNVAIICGILGRWLNLTVPEIAELVLAGLLHDFGKRQLPFDILNKPGKLSLSERKIIQTHPARGYMMLRNASLLSPAVLACVVQHHERRDGTGYPLGLTGDKIHPFAQIAAVADVYEAMTAPRPYRLELTPFAAGETLVNDMFQKLSPPVCNIFLNNLHDCFTGNTVLLNDGRKAKIIQLGRVLATRPLIQADDGTFIDLGETPELNIVKMLGPV